MPTVKKKFKVLEFLEASYHRIYNGKKSYCVLGAVGMAESCPIPDSNKNEVGIDTDNPKHKCVIKFRECITKKTGIDTFRLGLMQEYNDKGMWETLTVTLVRHGLYDKVVPFAMHQTDKEVECDVKA